MQLALAIDYAIILFHRFMEERNEYKPKHALIKALAKAIPEISSSSLTTMAGMVALMTMQFQIGMDLGRVLLKSIIFSMLAVFAFMPALIMMFEKQIEKSMHKNFVPNVEGLGKIIIKSRRFILPIFAVLIVGGIIFSNKTGYIFDVNSIESDKKTEYLDAREKIEEQFGKSNILAIVVPKEDYLKEASLLQEVSTIPGVKSVTGLANIEVGNKGEYVLTDRKLVISKTLNEAFPTIVTSGSIMAASGFVIGYITSNPTISSLGKTLGKGVVISMAMVMIVLPVLLYIFDFIIDKASFSRKINEEENKREDEEENSFITES